jgi:hypothetical protein
VVDALAQQRARPQSAARETPAALRCTAAKISCERWRPQPIEDWSLENLKENLIKIGSKAVRNGRYIAFQMAEIAIAPQCSKRILPPIAELRP